MDQLHLLPAVAGKALTVDPLSRTTHIEYVSPIQSNHVALNQHT